MPKINHTILVTLLALGFTNIGEIAKAQDNSQTTTETVLGSITMPYPENAAVSLGMGWNLQTNEAVPNICIENFKNYDVENYQSIQKLTQGNNSFSLSKSMDVTSSQSVSVAAGYAGLSGHASMSNQMSMTKQFDEQTDDRYVLAKQHIITKWSAITSSDGNLIELTNAAKKLISSTSKAQFHEQCGHGYVVRIEYGGTFYGLFNMHTTGYSSAQSFKSSFQAAAGVAYSGLGGSASIKASDSSDSDKKLSQSISSENISITVLQSGGSPSAAGTDIDSVLAQYRNFPLSLKSTDGGDSPATEFRMVIVPYPNMAPLTRVDAQLTSIAREYGKWKYLSTTVGKIISSEHGGDSQYTFINGVTLSPLGLENMQNMAQAKMDRISTIAGTCMDRIRGITQSSQGGAVDPCSLDSKNPDDFTKPGVNKVKYLLESKATGKLETYYVPIAESDVTYLVKLPFLSTIYDAMTKMKVDNSGATKYTDVIFNQVMGIYDERCPNGVIPRFCENAAKTEAAIDKYITPAKGNVYSMIQNTSYSSGNDCLQFTKNVDGGTWGNGSVFAKGCTTINNNAATKNNMYFFIDKSSNLVRSLSGLCMVSVLENYESKYNHANYKWGVCPDKYDGTTPPTNSHTIRGNQVYYSQLDAKPVTKLPNVYTLSDISINSMQGDITTSICLEVRPKTSFAIGWLGNTSCNESGASFSFKKPLFITDSALSFGIINSYRLGDVVVATPTVENYKDIGVTGVTLKNLKTVNSKLKTQYNNIDVNPTPTQIQGLI